MSLKSDLRSSARDANRRAAQKAKWALGAKDAVPGRQATHHPRPARPSDNHAPCIWRGFQHAQSSAPGVTPADAEQGLADARFEESEQRRGSSTAESGGDDHDHEEDEEDEDEEDALDGQSVFSGAVERAVRDFEDRETAVLVRQEWSVLDGEGEEMGLSPLKKPPRLAPATHSSASSGRQGARVGTARAMTASSDEDGEYEFV